MSKSKIEPSAEQIEPIIAAVNGKSIAINAGAGTGKSTTLKFITEYSKPNHRFIYIVFNKANAIEASLKMPSNVFVTTANSLAFRAVFDSNPSARKKYFKHSISVNRLASITGAYKEYTRLGEVGRMRFMISIQKTITEFCKTLDTEISMRHVPKDSDSQELDNILGYARVYWNLAKELKCDITHEVYMKIWSINKPSIPFDTILYDEAQDANALMVQEVNRQKANIIAVGDKHQQIYGFAGAVNALDKFNVTETHYLTQSYRYSQVIADVANLVLLNQKGVDINMKGSDFHESIVSNGIPMEYQNKTEMVIARTNGHILQLMIEANKNKLDYFAYVNAKEIKSLMLGMYALRYGDPDKVYHPDIKDFDDWSQFKIFLEEGGNPGLKTYYDLWGRFKLPHIMDAIKTAQDNENAMLPGSQTNLDYIFCTAHKSKGLEHDNITIGPDFKTPEDESYTDEETNLLYVALTRPRKILNIGNNEQLVELCT